MSLTNHAANFAIALNGREYKNLLSEAEIKLAQEHGVVIVYGYSDDNMEFRGAIDDEVGCFDGGSTYITSKGILYSECKNGSCPYFQQLLKTAKKITAVWHNKGKYTWTFETEIPHKTFVIFEDGEPYQKGIVISKEDLC